MKGTGHCGGATLGLFVGEVASAVKHGAIDGDMTVRDFRNFRRRILERRKQQFFDELRAPVATLKQLSNSFRPGAAELT